jgi:hypothetical protein
VIIGALLVTIVSVFILTASNPCDQALFAEITKRGEQTICQDGVNWDLHNASARNYLILSIWTVRYSDPDSERTRAKKYIGITGMFVNTTGKRLIEDRYYVSSP